MFVFLLLSILFLGGFILLLVSRNTSDIRNNWAKHRCSPEVIPFAAFYGHDTAENFTFCLKNIFQGQADSALTPFAGILGSFASTISVFLQSLGSLRLQLATLVGGVTHISQEFTDRVAQITMRVSITGKRMKMLMGRLFATFYAMMFMGMSGITAVTDLGDTVLFKFLDTFCFPPETAVYINGSTDPVQISAVKIGDRIGQGDNTELVTGTFSFSANGQPMVKFPDGLQVSTNHYVQLGTSWVQAKKHPDAIPAPDWEGGNSHPLICLNTENHTFSIGKYKFLDYDEISEADSQTMLWVEMKVNGGNTTPNSIRSIYPVLEYSPSVSETTPICMRNKVTRLARDIQLGDITNTGFVIGIIKKEVNLVCDITANETICEGTLIWDSQKNIWIRAGRIYPRRKLPAPKIFYGFIVSGTAQLQMPSGHRIRDYMEIHSPDTEQFYTKKLREESKGVAHQ